MAVGGPAGEPFRESGWEYHFAASPAVEAGDYERAIEIASEGLERRGDDVGLVYNVACYEAMAGRREDALRHLRQALELEPDKVRDWAQGRHGSRLDPRRSVLSALSGFRHEARVAFGPICARSRARVSPK